MIVYVYLCVYVGMCVEKGKGSKWQYVGCGYVRVNMFLEGDANVNSKCCSTLVCSSMYDAMWSVHQLELHMLTYINYMYL